MLVTRNNNNNNNLLGSTSRRNRLTSLIEWLIMGLLRFSHVRGLRHSLNHLHSL